MLFSLGSLHVYLMFNLSQLGVLIIDTPRELHGTFGMSPIRFFLCRGEIFDTRRSIGSFLRLARYDRKGKTEREDVFLSLKENVSCFSS